jgi:hypothetical protein
MSGVGDFLAAVAGNPVDRTTAYSEGRYRSAQTEQAIAAAKKSQIEATQKEREQEERDKLQENLRAQGVEGADTIATALLGGFGTFDTVTQGMGNLDSNRRRNAMENPETPWAQLQRNRAAEGVAAFDPIEAVGAGGVVNLMDDLVGAGGTPVNTTPLGDAMIADELAGADSRGKTSAISNFEYDQERGGETPFTAFVRNEQTVNAGGVPYATGLGGTGPARPIVAPEQVAANQGGIAQARTEGQGMGKRVLDFPAASGRMQRAVDGFQSIIDKIDMLAANEDLWTAVGAAGALSRIPGTPGAAVLGDIESLKAELGFQVLADMRAASPTGGALGQVAIQEGIWLQNAVASLNENMRPEDFRNRLNIIRERMRTFQQRAQDAYYRTYPEEAAQQQPAPGAAPAAGAEPRAVNPTTGETVVYRNGQWVPE